MDRIPNSAERAGASSILTLAMAYFPWASLATWSRRGLSRRHGPHHGAQKSTSTGVWAPEINSLKVVSVRLVMWDESIRRGFLKIIF